MPLPKTNCRVYAQFCQSTVRDKEKARIMLAKTWLLGLSVLVTVAVVLLLLHNPKVGELFHLHVRDRPKRRLLLAAIGFFVTFAVARSMAFAAYRSVGPFHYV